MAHIVSNHSDASRLALCGRANIEGAIDGAWWPSTSDLKTELPDLVAVLASWIGPIRRIVYDPGMWLRPPSRIIRGTTVIPVDPYRLVAPETIYVIGTRSRDAVLFVMPPSSPPDIVRRVLTAVSDSRQPMSVTVLRQLMRWPVSV